MNRLATAEKKALPWLPWLPGEQQQNNRETKGEKSSSFNIDCDVLNNNGFLLPDTKPNYDVEPYVSGQQVSVLSSVATVKM